MQVLRGAIPAIDGVNDPVDYTSTPPTYVTGTARRIKHPHASSTASTSDGGSAANGRHHEQHGSDTACSRTAAAEASSARYCSTAGALRTLCRNLRDGQLPMDAFLRSVGYTVRLC